MHSDKGFQEALPMDTALRRTEYTPTKEAAGAVANAAAESDASAMWPVWLALTLFWTYVTISNLLFSRTFTLVQGTNSAGDYFDWAARLLQHVLLYPVLVGAVWMSLHLGWRPVWRTVPVQVSLGVVFASLAVPLLHVSESLLHAYAMPKIGGLENDLGTAYSRLFGLPGQRHQLLISNMLSYFTSYCSAIALATGLALLQRYRESKLRLATLERAWSGARLAALRMQLSPHTLFNLMDMIHGQIGWDPPAAQSTVIQLSDLLRRLLSAGEREFCRLSDELHFVRLYLQLQQKRFADRLQLSLPVATQLPAAWVPSLILQPLVENAVIHGLADHTGTVAVRLEVSLSNDSLLLHVTNTMAVAYSPPREGIGLRNVRERLAVHFAGRGELQTAVTNTGEWSAWIRMPLLTDVPKALTDVA
jgi:hypothetical protein